MAYDKVVDSAQLDADLTSVASKIKEKAGVTDGITFPQGFLETLDGIEMGLTSINGRKIKTGTYTPATDVTSRIDIPTPVEDTQKSIFIWFNDTEYTNEEKPDLTFPRNCFGMLVPVGYRYTNNTYVKVYAGGGMDKYSSGANNIGSQIQLANNIDGIRIYASSSYPIKAGIPINWILLEVT